MTTTEAIQVWVKDDPSSPCQQCDVTTAYLEKHGIPFEKRSLSETTPEQMEAFRRIGQSAPVVVTENHGSWAGLRPDRLRAVRRSHTPKNSSDPPGPSIGPQPAMPHAGGPAAFTA